MGLAKGRRLEEVDPYVGFIALKNRASMLIGLGGGVGVGTLVLPSCYVNPADLLVPSGSLVQYSLPSSVPLDHTWSLWPQGKT